ncbi:MAG TPA: holo-ACP synthase [Candidatus Dormibacteraeota bacterium]|nr:holo-ACP synthase [Candidatus Dormibacteraeota bacterium]
MTDRDGRLANAADDLVLGDELNAGVDQVELEEFRRILTAGGDEFLGSVYTDEERNYCAGRLERLAVRFAAKEAATKALGTGLRGISPREIEVVSAPNGRPRLQLHGRAHSRARALGLTSMSVSLTHTRTAAVAFVVALCEPVNRTDSSLPLRKESRL